MSSDSQEHDLEVSGDSGNAEDDGMFGMDIDDSVPRRGGSAGSGGQHDEDDVMESAGSDAEMEAVAEILLDLQVNPGKARRVRVLNKRFRH
jgi:hypothetical protein